jgi:two-component system LytT family response regulator
MSNTLKAIIIDDEALARKRLLKLLTPYADVIEVIGEAANGEEGMQLIKSHAPDCVFLDIQMPVLNGFEMLQQLTHPPFIIFTTA